MDPAARDLGLRIKPPLGFDRRNRRIYLSRSFLWKASFRSGLSLRLHACYTVGFDASRGVVKKISEQQRIGQQGVHLLGARLLSVGLSFQPNGPLDAGIDGFLELRDPETGEVRAQWITAQLKTQKEGRLAIS